MLFPAVVESVAVLAILTSSSPVAPLQCHRHCCPICRISPMTLYRLYSKGNVYSGSFSEIPAHIPISHRLSFRPLEFWLPVERWEPISLSVAVCMPGNTVCCHIADSCFCSNIPCVTVSALPDTDTKLPLSIVITAIYFASEVLGESGIDGEWNPLLYIAAIIAVIAARFFRVPPPRLSALSI